MSIQERKDFFRWIMERYKEITGLKKDWFPCAYFSDDDQSIIEAVCYDANHHRMLASFHQTILTLFQKYYDHHQKSMTREPIFLQFTYFFISFHDPAEEIFGLMHYQSLQQNNNTILAITAAEQYNRPAQGINAQHIRILYC